MSYTKRLWEDFVDRVLELEQQGYSLDEIVQALNSSEIIVSTVLKQYPALKQYDPKPIQQEAL